MRIVLALAAVVSATFATAARAQICAPFTDVAAASPFCTNIQWIFNRGITLGCAANQYCPTPFVRRDQMAAFLNRRMVEAVLVARPRQRSLRYATGMHAST